MRLHDVEIDDKKVRENVQLKLIDQIIQHFDRSCYSVTNEIPWMTKCEIINYLKNKRIRICIESKEHESQVQNGSRKR